MLLLTRGARFGQHFLRPILPATKGVVSCLDVNYVALDWNIDGYYLYGGDFCNPVKKRTKNFSNLK